MPESALPEHLKKRKHEDYAWPFSLIPRAWTSFKFYGPPVLLWGNQRNFVPTVPYHGPYDYIFDKPSEFRYFGGPTWLPTLAPGPIPNPIISGVNFCWGVYGVRITSWLPALPMGYAFTWKLGRHWIHGRLGSRFDDVDHYTTFPSINFQIRKNHYAEAI